jgi:hypothetical protein
VLLSLLSVPWEDHALPGLDAVSLASVPGPYEKLGGLTVVRLYADRRFLACGVIVVAINLTRHFFRVWLPLFLQEDRGFRESQVQYFTSTYYLGTDAGSLTAGFGTLWLARRGLTVHRSQLVMFVFCIWMGTAMARPLFQAGQE